MYATQTAIEDLGRHFARIPVPIVFGDADDVVATLQFLSLETERHGSPDNF